MKRILTILFLLSSFIAFGQKYQPMLQPGYGFSRVKVDTVFTIPVIGVASLRNITGGRDTGQIRYNKTDSTVYIYSGSQWRPVGGSSTTSKVDSVTMYGDSLLYWINGSETFVTNIADAAAGGDTTIFETTLDSTGQANRRVLYSKNNKISSDNAFLFDDAKNKLIINNTNISSGHTDSKLFVAGQGQMDKLMLGSPSAGVGNKALRWNSTTGMVTVADTTTGGSDPLKLNISDTSAMLERYLDTLQAHNDRIIAAGGGSSYTFSQSVLNTAGTVTLLNDNATPGNAYVYGTNLSGTKGWQQSLPISLAGITDGQFLRYNSTGGYWENYTLSSSGWGLSGNSGITGSNFIGTTDNANVIFKRNNSVSGLLDSAVHKTSFGVQSGNGSTGTGTDNTSFGYFSLKSVNNSGTGNTAFGSQSLQANTSGLNNTAVGFQSQIATNTGFADVGVGAYSLNGNTTGNYNVGVGNQALQFNSTGSQNTAVGHATLGTTGANFSNSTAVGYTALRNSTAGNNTAVGFESGLSNTSGTNNTSVGYQAKAGSTGGYNTSIGSNSLQNLTIGSNNTAAGINSLINNVTGSYNLALGSQAGQFANGNTSNNLEKADSSIFIGFRTSPLGDSAVNQIVIAGYGAVGLGSNTTSIGNSSTTTTGIYGNLFLRSGMATPPASASDTGTAGEIRVTADYIYVCTATNTWKRSAISTW
jgi:hypothetical protein